VVEDVPLPVLAELPGCGDCAEAQADGVPCPGPRTECPTCGRARPKPAELDGILMPDGLYPTNV
jgi:hypothetical protein